MKIFTYKDFYHIADDNHPTLGSIFDMLITYNVGLFILDKTNALSLTGDKVSASIH